MPGRVLPVNRGSAPPLQACRLQTASDVRIAVLDMPCRALSAGGLEHQPPAPPGAKADDAAGSLPAGNLAAELAKCVRRRLSQPHQCRVAGSCTCILRQRCDQVTMPELRVHFCCPLLLLLLAGHRS
jgi:hypothetical protein